MGIINIYSSQWFIIMSTFPKATDEHCIVYDDAALDRLLDRSQQGMEEKQMEMNDYLSSFKVAHYEKRENQDGDSEEPEDDDSNVEVSQAMLNTLGLPDVGTS